MTAETYINGDRGEYTGELRGSWYVVRMIEGTLAGQERLTRRGPAGTDPWAGESIAAWQDTQADFRRLREAEDAA